MLTAQQIIDIRKSPNAIGFKPWSESIAFAQAIETAVRKEVADEVANHLDEIAISIENAIPTMQGKLLANLIRSGVTALDSHIKYAIESVDKI